MPSFRATVRYGASRKQYAVFDLDADNAAAALRALADRLDAAIADAADLIELRIQADPDKREFTPG